MSWSRGGLNSPSMASVLGSAAHAIPTTHAPSPDYVTDKKRKNGARDEARAPAQKRLKPKPMGRPRNGWTPTRKRKLVRLYLMTDLNVGEIAEVLRDLTFPTNKDGIVDAARAAGASNDVIAVFDGLPEQDYASADAVEQLLGSNGGSGLSI